MMPKESEPVKPRTREDVLHNLRSRMERENIDAIVAISPENVQHLTGAFIISQRIIRDRLAFAVCPRVGRPFFVVSSVVERTARTQSSFGEVVAYSEHAVRPIEALCKALDARGLGTGRVCIEMGYLTARDERWLRSDLPEIELLESDRILDQSRMVKTLDEIEIMKRHARLWEESVLEGFFAVQVGEAERAIADRLARNLLSRGADWIPFTSFASGPERTMIAHSVADETPVRRGDIMRVDMAGFFKGYYADFGRMAVVGNPSRSQREAYRRLVALQSETIRHARSGIMVSELYRRGLEVAREVGLDLSMAAIGHSLGLVLHEYPLITSNESEVLTENMTLCIEIAHRFAGVGRFHIEDLVHVTPQGGQRLTTLIDTSELLIVG